MASLILVGLLLQSDAVTEARRLAEQGELGRAIAVLSEARKEGSSPALLAFLAQLQTANDQIPQAAETLAAALELAPRQARLRATLGALSFRLGRLEEAEDQLRRALSLDGENPIAHYYLAAVFHGTGRTNEAKRSVAQALARLPETSAFDPNDYSPRVNALYLRGELELASGEDEAAERTLRAVLAAEPTHASACYLLGRILTRTGRRDEGAQALERFQRTKKAQEHLDLGLNLSRHAGEHDEALEELELAVEAFPDHPRALYFLALELARAGRVAEAAETLERLVDLRPDAAEVVQPFIGRLRR